MSKTNKLSIIMVSYYSASMINRCLKSIPGNIKIIIVNNASKDELESKINKKSNIKILTPIHNLGNGGGFNYGLKYCKTPYVLYLDVDTRLEKNTLKNLLALAKKTKNWGVIAPNIRNYKYSKKHFINDLDKNFYEMNFVEGCALLFNYNKVKHLGFYDDKIFLYYEEDDIFFRYIKNKKKILLAKNTYISHIGNSSTDKKFSHEIELNRNWHLMWSKFYYLKKNFSYIDAIKKTFKTLITSFFKIIFYRLSNKKKFQIYFNRFEGLLHSYQNKPSSRRPRIE